LSARTRYRYRLAVLQGLGLALFAAGLAALASALAI
jgi:hypothetical protein